MSRKAGLKPLPGKSPAARYDSFERWVFCFFPMPHTVRATRSSSSDQGKGVQAHRAVHAGARTDAYRLLCSGWRWCVAG